MRALQRLDNAVEHAGLDRRKMPAFQQPEHCGEIGIAVDVLLRLIVAAQLLHVISAQTEEEKVLFAHRLHDLDVRAIVGADGHRAVHHELHIAGARGLFAGSGNLFGQIGGSADFFHLGNVVVRLEHHLELVADQRVIVDHGSHVVDQLDDLLGADVTGRGLAADQHAAIDPALGIAGMDAVVQVNHVQHIEQLALVLVDALDLDIEHRGRIEHHAGVMLNHIGQALLVGQANSPPALLEGRIVSQRLELRQALQIGLPAVADRLGEQVSQLRVGAGDPATRGHAVGLVVELLRPHFVEVAEQAGGKQIGVQLGHPVDREAADDCQPGHANLRLATLFDQRHAAHPLDIARPALAHLRKKARVDLVDDLQQARQQVLE